MDKNTSKHPALLNLICPECKERFQSMTILLPFHQITDEEKMPPYSIGVAGPPECPGSLHLAQMIVKPCPDAGKEDHKSAECPLCKGLVRSVIILQFEKRVIDEDHWKPVAEAEVREKLGAYYSNVDDVISFMYSGQPARTPLAHWRIAPPQKNPKNYRAE